MRWERAQLDRELARLGQDVTLRRIYGSAPSTTTKDVALKAYVRSPTSAEMLSGVPQSDCFVIISPTAIANAGWPAGEIASATVADPSVPRRNDRVLIAGRQRNVENVNPFVIANECVRIELQVRG